MQYRAPAASPLLAIGLLIVSTCASAVSPANQPLTLQDYFAAALRRSEVVATQKESIVQAEERLRQAGGALLPTLSGYGSYKWQDPVPSGTSDSSISPNRQPLAKITATQPLFKGFREFAALRQSRELLGAQQEDYQQARVTLFKDVAQNFYEILSLEQDLNTYEKEIELNLKREAELNDRVRIGRSRVAEVLTVQSAISTLRATTEQLRGQLRTAREAFAFLSGLDSATRLNDTETVPPELEPLADYLALQGSRPDVKASRRRYDAARENVGVAKGAHLPSLDLNGNYYFERVGNLKESEWDIELVLTIPIYSGGTIQSKVREALSQQTQAELSASQANRQAEQEIRSLHQSVQHLKSQVAALEKATDAADKNYRAQLHDYRLGLVTNLEVLQALATFQENQRALDRARNSSKLDWLRLQAAAARRPGDDSRAP